MTTTNYGVMAWLFAAIGAFIAAIIFAPLAIYFAVKALAQRPRQDFAAGFIGVAELIHFAHPKEVEAWIMNLPPGGATAIAAVVVGYFLVVVVGSLFSTKPNPAA